MFSFGFYNSIEHDRVYDAIQVSQIFDGIISDGVYEQYKHAMILKVNSGGEVYVQPGRAWLDHTWNYVDSDTIVEDTPQSDLVYPRIDAIVIDIQADIDHRTNAIIWVKGEAGANPKKPKMIKTYDHHQYPLGYITREPNVEKIKQSNIENTVGTSELPFVTGIIQTLDIDELILQWKAQWDEFLSGKRIEIKDWFDSLRDFLDENAEVKLTEAVIEVTKNEFNHYYGLINQNTIINSTDGIIVATSDEAILTTKIGDPDNNGTRQIIETIEPKGKDAKYKYTKKTTLSKISNGYNVAETYTFEPLNP